VYRQNLISTNHQYAMVWVVRPRYATARIHGTKNGRTAACANKLKDANIICFCCFNDLSGGLLPLLYQINLPNNSHALNCTQFLLWPLQTKNERHESKQSIMGER
jgi:hypothetical protein